ncbi:MAG: hypothetical protein U0Y68_26355 [Blastocatellia bacterium]
MAAALLVAAGAAGLRRVVAERTTATPKANVAPAPTRNSGAPSTLAAPANGQKILGVYEGKFDAKTRSITGIQPIAGDLKAFGRADANTAIPESSITRTFMRSCANPSGSVPCQSSAPANTISGEHKITNNSSLKFYNTRLIFTDFLSARGGIPVTANVYFNDGQVPANGKLGVSREYGDIDPGGTSTRVWSFSFPSGSIQSFYFRFVIYADMGVAAESVEPAAVQNNANRTVTINGQGFNNPTVTLLDSNGNTVATLASNAVSASILTATIPAGTGAGIYSLRVTNAGGTAGGAGSSTLLNKLNVTGVPDAGHTGAPTSLSDIGPYLVTGNTTISGTALPGTVVYVNDGVTIQIGTGGLNANGGVPGVPLTSPGQIVFTRAPNATAWGGLDATSAASSEVSLKNCVVEYGGAGGGAQINISGSGRTLRFTDSVSRRSAGAGLRATGNSDFLTGFTRSRVENNLGVAVLLSANAALGIGTTGAGMGDLDASNANTTIPDQSYYFSLANVIRNNGTDAVQIDSTANDFTRSGVLVGQGDVPLQIRGSNGNPSVVGKSGGAPGAELFINPNAIIQLDAGMDFKAGDGTLFGSIGANGYAGYSQSPSADTSISRRIVFEKIPGGGAFGALVFSSTSGATSLLNFVTVRNGGTTPSGSAQVVIENIAYTFGFTNSESNGSSSYGLQFRSNNTVTRTGSTYSGNSTGTENVVNGGNNGPATITTVAGSLYGDGNQADLAPLVKSVAMAVDAGRGVYIADEERLGGVNIRFANTSNTTQKIAGIDVPAKSIKRITSGVLLGFEAPANEQMDNIDLLTIKNIALSADKKVLYFLSIGAGFHLVRGINVTPGAAANTSPVTIGTTATDVGRASTIYNDSFNTPALSDDLQGFAVNPISNEIYIADTTKEQVFKLTQAGNLTVFAGVGRGSRPVPITNWKAFPYPTSGANPNATDIFLASPDSITVSDDGSTVYINDSQYGRVMRVQAGVARLVVQQGTFSGGTYDFSINPMPSGMALQNGSLFIANIGTQTVIRIDNPSTVSAQAAPVNDTISTPTANLVAGTAGTVCDFTSTTCGEGGSISSQNFDFHAMYSNLASDTNGVYVNDQAGNYRGRIRYLNLSNGTVTHGGVAVSASTAKTIIGSGLPDPYDNGLATSAALTSPVGTAVDSNGNVFIGEASVLGNGSLRFANLGNSNVTILGRTVTPGQIIKINKDVADSTTAESTTPTTAYFYTIQGLKYTSEGLYIVDSNGVSVPAAQGLRTSRVRFLNLSNSTVTFFGSLAVAPGEIKTIAGGSTDPGSIGDGNIATSAKLLGATDVEVNPNTNDIYISESYGRRVRKVLRSTGTISTLSGGTSGLGLNQYTGLAFDGSGRLLVASYSTNQVLRETAAGSSTFSAVTSTVAINRPRDMAVDASGNLYVMNSGTQQIIKIDLATSTGTVFVGTGTQGFAGDGGAPTSARIDIVADDVDIDASQATGNLIQTVNITVGSNGAVYFADNKNIRIRRVQ